MAEEIFIKPFSNAKASVKIPGSKSLTNRALILAAVMGGKTLVEDALFSRDTEIMSDCLEKLGFSVVPDRFARTFEITSSAGGIPNSEADMFVGNAGTAARFVTALASLKKGGKYRFDSDKAMYARPIRGLIRALQSQGAKFEFEGAEYHFPFKMKTCSLKGGEIDIDAGASSQMLSGLLMALPLAENDSLVTLQGETVSRPFVDMTLKIMRQFGIDCGAKNDMEYYVRRHPQTNGERKYRIEPDATAASYFAMLPFVTGGVVRIDNLAACKLQGDIEFIRVIENLGLVRTRRVGNDLLVEGVENPEIAESVELDFNDISDTFLTLAAVSPILPCTLKIRGISHTRSQETDRVAAVASQLEKLCEHVEFDADSIYIRPFPRAVLAERVSRERVHIETFDDHRIAMSFSILGCADITGSGKPWLGILNPSCTAKTWKEFFEALYTVRGDSMDFRVVAIDGGAAVGKSTVSGECSGILGYMHVDTGAHYRALTYGLLAKNITPDASEETVKSALSGIAIGTSLVGNDAVITVNSKILSDADIRNERINANVSRFAAMPAVREFLKDYQRSMADFARANRFSGMIMEGRDIGSVIFPDAACRIFLDADEATRAARRAKEGVADSVAARDKLDKTRKTAPLVCPEGAWRIDTSKMAKEKVVLKTLSLVLAS